MNYNFKECKKMVNFAGKKQGRYYAEQVDVEAIINCCFSRVEENKCNIYASCALDSKTYKEVGLDVGLSYARVREIIMDIAYEIILLCENPRYLETDITEMSEIYCLGLPNPIYRLLVGARLTTVGQLTQITESDLISIRGMGKKKVKLLNDELSKYNLSLKDYEPKLERVKSTIDSVKITLRVPKDKLRNGNNCIIVNYDPDSGKYTYVNSL